MIAQEGTREAPADQAFVFRTIDLDADVARLVRMYNEIQAADGLGEPTSETDQRAELTRPTIDLARDRWVVEAPGDPDRLIAEGGAGKAGETDRAWLFVNVHPDWRRRGLGSALLARSLARAREMGVTYVNSGADDRESARNAFLRKHGFTRGATWVMMRAPATTVLDAPALPPGYTVRPYSEVQNVAVLTEALNRGFIGHYQHRDLAEAEIAHWMTRDHFRPEGMFLAFGPAGDVAGLCLTNISAERSAQRGEPTGYIDDLGVVPEHRRRGLGRALLLIGMQWLRAQGQGAIELDAWSHNDLAMPLYTDVGFVVAEQGTQYVRTL